MSPPFALCLLCLQMYIHSVVFHSADASHTLCMTQRFIFYSCCCRGHLLCFVIVGRGDLSVLSHSADADLYVCRNVLSLLHVYVASFWVVLVMFAEVYLFCCDSFRRCVTHYMYDAMFYILFSLVVAGGIWLSVFTFSVACSLYRLAIHGVGWLLAS